MPVAAAVLAALVVPGCAPAGQEPRGVPTGATQPPTSAPPGPTSTTQEYLPGRAADVFLPEGASQAPVVVLVPGGSWASADRAGLTPLAADLASAGAVAVNATHRAVDDGGRFPQMVGDVICSVDFAVARSREAGITPGPVIIVGHSSGAHLAALAALGTSRFRQECAAPPATVDGFVGLAGGYDLEQVADLVEPFFGQPLARAPELWASGDPYAWARRPAGDRPLRVLLLHGDEDPQVPPEWSRRLATALEQGGHDVTVEVIAGADHHSVYSAEVAGPILHRWLGAMDPG